MKRTNGGWRIIFVLAGLGTGLAPRASGQCPNPAGSAPGAPGIALPATPTPVALGVKVTATPTTLAVTWNGLNGACNYSLRWFAAGQSPTSGLDG